MTKRYIAAALLALSASGAAFIATHEGTGPTQEQGGQIVALAYADPAHGWALPTICNGHTRGVLRHQRATLGQCESWLIEDASYAGRAIARCTPVRLTQPQYDALVSLVYNIGPGNYCSSTLARHLNAGRCIAAAQQFDRWTYAGGQRLPGLIKRRAAERARFESDCPAITNEKEP